MQQSFDRIKYNFGDIKKTNPKEIWDKISTIDLGRLGAILGINQRYMSSEQDSVIKYLLVSEALLLGIGGGQTETALCLREIYPHLDFKSSETTMITYPKWAQPDPRINPNGYTSGYTNSYLPIPIYSTDKSVGLEHKIMVLYGAIIPASCNVGEILLWKTNHKLMDRFFISGREGEIVFFNTAYFITAVEEKNAKWDIRFLFKNKNIKGLTDNIQLLGYICETVGSTAIG